MEPEGAAFYVFRNAENSYNITKIEKDGHKLNEGNTPLTTGTSNVFIRDNKLEVSVTNLWINRLIGDEKLPPEERKTSTNLVNEKGRYDKLTTRNSDEYLRYAGLMGPVFIMFSGMHELPNTNKLANTY